MCECNSTYCDSVGSVTLPPLGQYSSYLSSMAGSRLEPGQGQVQVNSTGTGEWRFGLLLGCPWCLDQAHSVSFVCVSLRPQIDYRSLPEVSEDQGIWWSNDRRSRH